MFTLAIVSPCYNEEAVLDSSASQLDYLMKDLIARKKISDKSFVALVNDGSRDKTWNIISDLNKNNKLFRGINLVTNTGKEGALLAGMMYAKEYSDAVITIDVDLQDDINAIEKMIDAHEEGAEVVYGVKVSREADPFLKRFTAESFYKFQASLGVNTIYNHTDFRLMSKRVLQHLSLYPERNMFLRGLICDMGFPSATVDDIIKEREAGETKFNYTKLLALAIDGITSFSVKPMQLITYFGIFFMIVFLGILIYVIVSLVMNYAVSGWASLMLSIWFVGGIILLALGITGTYIGKIFKEVKRRPLYNIGEILE